MGGLQGPRARYAPPRAGALLADELATALGLPAGSIDYAGTVTHARAGAPAVGRHQFLRGRAQPLLRGPSPRYPEVVVTR